VVNTLTGKKLKGGLSARGYPQCTLANHLGAKCFLIHRSVAEAFIPNSENKPCVNHIDGIKTNNNVDNLEWCTHKENMKHAYDLKLRNQKGSDCNFAILTDEQVLQIKDLLTQNRKQRDIAKMYNVHESTISDIKTGRSWSHL